MECEDIWPLWYSWVLWSKNGLTKARNIWKTCLMYALRPHGDQVRVRPHMMNNIVSMYSPAQIVSLILNGMWALIGSVKLGVNVGIWLSCTTPIPIEHREFPENSKCVLCCKVPLNWVRQETDSYNVHPMVSRSNTRTSTDIQTHNDGNNRQNDTSMNAPTPSTSGWPGRSPSHTQTMHDARTHAH
jgi:hypothetical protein